MGIEKIVAKQYRDKVNHAAKQFNDLSMPPEGWLRTVRKALHMSGPQLARRLGVTKAQVSRTEIAELSGGVTIKTMQNMAESMNCHFVYAVVPEQEIEELIKKRAQEKAREQVKAASTQMALEDQALSGEQLALEVERLTLEIVENLPSDLWSDE